MGQVVETPSQPEDDDDFSFGDSITDFSELDDVDGGFVDSSSDDIPQE